MAAPTMDYQLANKNYSECYGYSDVWNDLLIVGGLVLAKHLPTLLDFVSDTIAQIMSNGYAVRVKKGDFELCFGKEHDLYETSAPEAHRVKARA